MLNHAEPLLHCAYRAVDLLERYGHGAAENGVNVVPATDRTTRHARNHPMAPTPCTSKHNRGLSDGVLAAAASSSLQDRDHQLYWGRGDDVLGPKTRDFQVFRKMPADNGS
jgi:hypothetical protein